MTDPTPTRDEAVRETIARIIDPHSFVPYAPTGAADDAVFAGMVQSSLEDAYRKADRIIAALAPAPASGGVDAVGAPALSEIPASVVVAMSKRLGAVEPFNDLSDDEIAAMFRDGLAAYLASLSPAATPVSEAEPPVAEAIDDLIMAALNHERAAPGHERGSTLRILNSARSRVAALAKPASSPAGGDVREALDWLAGFNAYRAGPCAQDVRTAFISGWMHRAEQEAALSPSTSGGRVGE